MITPEQLAKLKQVYDAGGMSAEDAAAFQKDLSSGMLEAPAQQAPEEQAQTKRIQLHESIVNAYNEGKMDNASMAELERDVASGLAIMPKYLKLTPPEPSLMSRVGDMFTGNLRETPTSNALPDWGNLPELDQVNSPSIKPFLSSLISSPEETVKVLKVNFPDIGVTKDEKGNLIIKSAINGNQYAVKPGFQTSDINPTLTKAALAIPAAMSNGILPAAGYAALTQTGIEGAQAGLGGEFNPYDIAAAGLVGGAVPAVGRVGGAVKQAFLPEVTQASAPIAFDTVAKTLQTASKGNVGAGEILAAQASPDPAVKAAADQLGVTELLQPDHLTNNQTTRELWQAVKSTIGSETRGNELEGLRAVGDRAVALIDELGGTSDLSTLDSTVKAGMATIESDFHQAAQGFYDQVAARIPNGTQVSAPQTLSLLKEMKADGLELSSAENRLLKKLGDTENPPTYAYLDQQRKLIGQATRSLQPGVYGNMESGAAKRLYAVLAEDQKVIAHAEGAGNLFDAAQANTVMYKKIQEDITSIYGDKLDKSLVMPLMTGIKSLEKGDTSKFINLINSLPSSMRQEVTTSGLTVAFGKRIATGQLNYNTYANWYNGLNKNAQAKAALFSNLTPEARGTVEALGVLSENIAKTTRERITTGRIQDLYRVFDPADSLLGKVYSTARSASHGVDVVPGMSGLAQALKFTSKTKEESVKAADKFISSPDFAALVQNNTLTPEQAAAKMAKSQTFQRFWSSLKDRKPASSGEIWLRAAIQTVGNEHPASQ